MQKENNKKSYFLLTCKKLAIKFQRAYAQSLAGKLYHTITEKGKPTPNKRQLAKKTEGII